MWGIGINKYYTRRKRRKRNTIREMGMAVKKWKD
jgi:hypothetical protein